MTHFIPALCCRHDWRPVTNPGPHVDEFCKTCGATCVRNSRGTIVEHDRCADHREPERQASCLMGMVS